MHAARGILTMRGGMTSHAAVVARKGPRLRRRRRRPARRLRHADDLGQGPGRESGEIITINGSIGEVMVGEVPTTARALRRFPTLMEMGDKVRKMGVRANADTPTDAKNARRFGAEGIGLPPRSICSSRATASPRCAR